MTLTRRVDNVSSPPKTLCTKLNIRYLFGFVWEALQITKVWSCEPEMNGFRFFKSKPNPTISFRNPIQIR